MTTSRSERALQDIATYLRSIDKSLGELVKAAQEGNTVFEKFKQHIQKAKDEIEEKVSDKLMEEELNPTLRKHSGEPQGKLGDKK